MGKLIATIVCVLVIRKLFRLDREGTGEVKTSKALWLPTYWLFIGASRNLSEWLHVAPTGGSQVYLEGSPLDRAVLTAVLAIGVIVLLRRARQTGMLLRSNLPILFYFLYCATSAIWSDFPDVAFKRWFRAIGDVVMVLIVLSDPNWVAAIRRLLTRLGYVLIPVSILFNRYYPQYGRTFSHSGVPSWTGVTVEKNALGALSLIFGLAFLFYFLQLYQKEEVPRRKGPLIGLGSIVAMSLYLLVGSNSATALASFFLAGVPMVLTILFRWARKPAIVNTMVFAALGTACSALFLNLGSGMLEGLGRNATLTGRTDIWRDALSLVQNPLLGTGFMSFWVGPRYDQMEVLTGMSLNQSHNGFLEIFLNLGWIGVVLIAFILIFAYGRIITALRLMTPTASLGLAYFITVVSQNFTEASFGMAGPVWLGFLMTTMASSEASPPGEFPPRGPSQIEALTNPKLRTPGSLGRFRQPVRTRSSESRTGIGLSVDHRLDADVNPASTLNKLRRDYTRLT